ncbi:hypothetical protein CA264_04020 [Pontibacter actiniarum]|uniref:STAS/SEC14 domain-containing protein n=2 Tax=Pontibacter actiniarum TaxID=323450 RepID=A0A1X9YP83_9BACT|nr:hypothetical protein CA264_04020 [Pontibacter actiniarum]
MLLPVSTIYRMSKPFLTLRYSPSLEYLSASWLHPISSPLYRQGIRTIAVCVARLGVKLVYNDLSRAGAPTKQDQCCTASFLKQALAKTPLRRSAKVIPTDEPRWQEYKSLTQQAKDLPYETGIFSCGTEATSWLFAGIKKKSCAPDDLLAIPMSDNLPDLTNLPLSSSSPEQPVSTGPPAEGNVMLFRTDFVEVNLCQQQRILLVCWLRPVISWEYRQGIEEAGRFLLEYRLEKLLINNQRLGVLNIDDQNWLAATSIRLIAQSNLKRLAVISSSDILQQLTDETLDARVKSADLQFHTRYFFWEDEALEWLALSFEAPEL